MKILLLIVGLFTSLSLFAQQIIIYQGPVEQSHQVKAISASGIYTESGWIELTAIDSITIIQDGPYSRSLRGMRFGRNAPEEVIPSGELTVDQDSRQINFQVIFDIPGKTAYELFTETKRWITMTYVNPASVQLAEFEGEMVRGKGFTERAVRLSAGVVGDLSYQFKVDFKDARVRYTVYNMEVFTPARYSVGSYLLKSTGEFRTNSQAASVRQSVTQYCNGLLANIYLFLATEGQSTTDDDW